MLFLSLATLVSLSGCSGRDKDTADTDMDTDTNTTDTDTDTNTGMGGFTLSGVAVDLSTGAAADGTGLTVAVADPTPALAGGEMDMLATGTINADGTFTVPGVVTTSTVGLFVVITGTGVMNSASGVAATSYTGLGDGDTLSGATAYVVTDALSAGVNGSISAVGGSHDIVTEGVLFGFVLDSTGAPVAGATAGCAGCGTPDFYYADAVSADGLFSSSTGINTTTDPAARSMFVVPGAPIASYFADDGGVHDFPSQLGGSLPAFAAFIAINATN